MISLTKIAMQPKNPVDINVSVCVYECVYIYMRVCVYMCMWAIMSLWRGHLAVDSQSLPGADV